MTEELTLKWFKYLGGNEGESTVTLYDKYENRCIELGYLNGSIIYSDSISTYKVH